MGNRFSNCSQKEESITIINESDHVHVIVTQAQDEECQLKTDSGGTMGDLNQTKQLKMESEVTAQEQPANAIGNANEFIVYKKKNIKKIKKKCKKNKKHLQ
jgi:hypothetical protein